VKIDGEVIYQVKRWRVVRIVPQIQVADYSAPRVPDRLRLWRPTARAGSAKAVEAHRACRIG
jgi:hypothetical protein